MNSRARGRFGPRQSEAEEDRVAGRHVVNRDALAEPVFRNRRARSSGPSLRNWSGRVEARCAGTRGGQRWRLRLSARCGGADYSRSVSASTSKPASRASAAQTIESSPPRQKNDRAALQPDAEPGADREHRRIEGSVTAQAMRMVGQNAHPARSIRGMIRNSGSEGITKPKVLGCCSAIRTDRACPPQQMIAINDVAAAKRGAAPPRASACHLGDMAISTPDTAADEQI